MFHSVNYTSDEPEMHEAQPQHQRTALLKLAESVASIGHWQIDLKEGRLFWSDQVYRIHGVTRATYAPDLESAIDFYHPDDAPRVSSMVDSAISDRRPFEFECRIVRPDGTLRFVQSRALVQVDDNDEVVSVFGVFQDVTQAQEVQRSLEKQVERFSLIMRGAGVGLWDWDVLADEFHLSDRGAVLAGLPSQCTGEAFLSAVAEQDQAMVRDALAAHMERDEALDLECRIAHANGEIKWVHLCGQAQRNNNGAVQRLAGSLQDISKQKYRDSVE